MRKDQKLKGVLKYESYRDALYNYLKTNKRMPSYSEATKLLGFKSKDSAYRAIQKLINLGFINKDTMGKLIPKNKNSYKIREENIHSEKYTIKMLGLVEAGFPTASEESLLDSISLDECIIREREASFMLRVKGDSMKDAGIYNGDMVVVEKRTGARVGDIVVAEIDGAWTMKYLRKDKSRGFYLEPANKAFKNIYPKEEMRIGAVVRAVIRKFE